MRSRQRTAAAAVALAIAAGIFWVGRITAPSSPPAAVELRRCEYPSWVEVWRSGELYRSPDPDQPRRGHGPILQASR